MHDVNFCVTGLATLSLGGFPEEREYLPSEKDKVSLMIRSTRAEFSG